MAYKRNNSDDVFRQVCIYLSLLLSLSLFGSASSVGADTIPDNLRFSADSTPVALENVELFSSATVVGLPTQLQVRFTTPDLEFPFDYRVGVTFPDAFGFGSAVSATFSDDSPAPDPEIQAVEIIDHTVIFTFRRTFFAPKAGQGGIIDISGVTLPTTAGAYAATVFMSDIDFVVLAGPSFTSEVILAPDVAASVSLTPVANIVATAGDLLEFSANSVDQYGNAVSDSALNWSLTLESDSLGVVTPGNLLATKVGVGRVTVSSDLAADTSGLITVVAGVLARLELEIDREQFVGSPICGVGIVRAFDQFENPKGNFGGDDSLLQLSVSDGYVAPVLIPVTAFDSDGVLDLAAYDVRFGGLFGDVEVGASVGSVVSPSRQLTLGGIMTSITSGGRLTAVLPTDKKVTTRFRFRPINIPNVMIDSLVVILPDGNRVVLKDALAVFGDFELPEFMTRSAGSALSEDTLSISGFGTYISQTSTDGGCQFVTYSQLVIDYIDEHIILTPKVDSLLLRSSYSLFRGFGFSSPYPVQLVLGGSLFLVDAENESFEFGQYWGMYVGGSLVGATGVDTLLTQISPIPSSIDAGLYDMQVVARLSDGVFEFEDTASSSSQLYLVEPARLVAGAEDFSPRFAGPGDSVEFSLNVGFEGVFDESSVFAVDLELYSGPEIIEVSASYSEATGLIETSAPMLLPLRFAETNWGVRYLISVSEQGSRRNDTLDLGADVFRIGPLNQIDLVELGSDAPNFPFVSVGQEFNIIARLVNNAQFEIVGVQVGLGGTAVNVRTLAAHDTIEVAIPYIAGLLPGFEDVSVSVTSGAFRAESERQVQLTVQSSALLTLVAELDLEDGAGLQRVIEVGDDLILHLSLENAGEAVVSGGSVLITAKGAGLDLTTIVEVRDFGAPVNLGAPSNAGSVVVIVAILDEPQELNTAQAVEFTMPAGSSFGETVSAVERELLVNANITAGDSTAIVFGERREMFAVEISNSSALMSADVEVERIVAVFRGLDGQRISPSAVINLDRSALFDNQGKAVALFHVSGDSLLMDITKNNLPVGESVTYRFEAQFVAKSNVRKFTLRAPLDGIEINVVSGPREGARLAVQAPVGAPPFESSEYILTAAAFVESFQPQNNPFNPEISSTQYSYTLSVDSDIELAIYTLTGQLVRRYNFDSGSQFGAAGVQTPAWDGRNGQGEIVRDGVYVVVLTNLGTGEKAYLKQAVLK